MRHTDNKVCHAIQTLSRKEESCLGTLPIRDVRSPRDIDASTLTYDTALCGQRNSAAQLFVRLKLGIFQKLFLCPPQLDRKSTRLNSSHSQISYAVFCLKK